MTVAVVGSATVGEVASGTSVTCNVPAGVVAGDLLAVALTGTNGSVPDQTGWTTIASGTSAPPSGMLYRVATGSEPASYTFTGLNSGGANRLTAEMVRLAGADTATPLDAPGQRNAGSGSASLTVAGVTTVTDGALVLYTAGVNAATATDITPDPNTTLVVNSSGTGRRTILAQEARPTAGATGSRTFTETGTTGVAIAVITAAFRPAPGGGGDTTAPTVPTGITAAANSATQVTVSWTASTDAVGVTSYRVRRGGVDLAAATAVTGTSFVDTTAAASTSYSYTVSAVDAAGNRSAESTAAPVTTPAPAPAGGSFTFAITGTPDGDSVPIKVKTAGASSVRLKVATNSGLTTGVVWTAAQTPDASQYTTHVISGLAAGTGYFYAAEVDGVLSATVGQFVTDTPAAQRSFRVAFASCLLTGQAGTAAFDNITANAPELFIHLGDFHYDNNTTTDQAAHQAGIENQIGVNTGLARVIRTIPLAYQWSDHDSGNNDWTGGPAAWTPSYNAAYREVIPVEGTLPTGGIYRSFGRGRVKFILTDSRSYKSPSSATDDASKTMFGATQEAWIASELADPAYPVKVICLDVPWVEATTAGSDKWGGYKAAAQRLVDAIASAGAHVFLIHGDAHSLCADDGTSASNTGGLPVAGAAPLGNNASLKGGPYSQGTWPTFNSGVLSFFHGLLDVTDTGTAITVHYSGRDETNAERVTLSKTFSVAATTTLDKLRLGGGTVGLRVGANPATKVHLGTTQVWP